jgi:hypothetical protein
LKKILVFALLFGASAAHGQLASSTSSGQGIDIETCDTIHSGGQLRHKKTYAFYLNFNNNGNVTKYLNKFDVDYAQPDIKFEKNENSKNWYFLDAGGSFEFSKEVKDRGYAVAPNSVIRAIEVGRYPDSENFWNWRVKNKGRGAAGTEKDFDFALKYTLWVDTTDTPKDQTDDMQVVSCVFYGVIDE